MDVLKTMVTYRDWYGATITESVEDMIKRINKLEETEASLRQFPPRITGIKLEDF